MVGIQPIITKFNNPVKFTPLKANQAQREQLYKEMLDDTFKGLSQIADCKNAKKTININKAQDFFKKFIPNVAFDIQGQRNKVFNKIAFMQTNFESETFKKTDYSLFCKVDKKGNIKLDSNYFGLMMHEITHMYEQLTKPKIYLTYSKFQKIHKTNEKTIEAVQKWNEIYSNSVYNSHGTWTNKETFRKTLKDELKTNKVDNNYEKIQYLKEFYLHLNFEKNAYKSSSKYSFLREKEYRADFNNLQTTTKKKPAPREKMYTEKFGNFFHFDEKLQVLHEEFLKAVKLERENMKSK